MRLGIFVGGSDIGFEILFQLAKHFGEIDAGIFGERRSFGAAQRRRCMRDGIAGGCGLEHRLTGAVHAIAAGGHGADACWCAGAHGMRQRLRGRRGGCVTALAAQRDWLPWARPGRSCGRGTGGTGLAFATGAGRLEAQRPARPSGNLRPEKLRCRQRIRREPAQSMRQRPWVPGPEPRRAWRHGRRSRCSWLGNSAGQEAVAQRRFEIGDEFFENAWFWFRLWLRNRLVNGVSERRVQARARQDASATTGISSTAGGFGLEGTGSSTAALRRQRLPRPELRRPDFDRRNIFGGELFDYGLDGDGASSSAGCVAASTSARSSAILA